MYNLPKYRDVIGLKGDRQAQPIGIDSANAHWVTHFTCAA